jgi:hypothetical protein
MSATSTMEQGQKAKAPQHKGCNTKLWVGVGVLVVIAVGLGVGLGVGLSGSKPGAKIRGTWYDSAYSGQHITFTDTAIYVDSAYPSYRKVIEYTDTYVITQNLATAGYNPSKFSRLNYHDNADGSWGFCSVIYDAATAADAVAFDHTGTYDPAATTGGCGASNFDHTNLVAYPMPLIGKYNDNYKDTLTVTATKWGANTMEAYGPAFALYQNAADDEYNPSKWSRIDFHTMTGGPAYGYCTSIYNAATAEEAYLFDAVGTGTYNVSNAASGCAGWGHTEITVA